MTSAIPASYQLNYEVTAGIAGHFSGFKLFFMSSLFPIALIHVTFA